MSAKPPIDTSRCPLCGGPNGCAMAAPAQAPTPCWCTRVRFRAETLARVPQPLRRRACICRRCAEVQDEAGAD
ncbi:cysteine-rich CWC family protein [Caldimonas taiwanensis]|uniref:cysteine-rich CWC family protein n=1 Tax=Caldimonas taiwanensis TaxID=307483 RepID=UPI0018DD0307|nr:cysteine-rich CWC family protein [Caldimonas taiwanensis]